jgi:hypothetical protein
LIYIGIDPGFGGAIAAINRAGGLVGVIDTPFAMDGKRRCYLVDSMRSAILELGGGIGCDVYRAAIEKVHSMPKQGVVSSFTFGEGYGLWRGILAGLRISVDLVEPQRWKKSILDGVGKEKEASRIRAQQLFPGADLKLVKHHGRAEALLIAEYRRRQG